MRRSRRLLLLCWIARQFSVFSVTPSWRYATCPWYNKASCEGCERLFLLRQIFHHSSRFLTFTTNFSTIFAYQLHSYADNLFNIKHDTAAGHTRAVFQAMQLLFIFFLFFTFCYCKLVLLAHNIRRCLVKAAEAIPLAQDHLSFCSFCRTIFR